MRREAGVTLLEVLVAVTLLSVLSVGMMMAMRIGLSAFSRTDSRLMDNRRVAGAQRIVEQELEGLLPAMVPCGGPEGGAGAPKAAFFSGRATGITMVSGFSLQEAWRGRPQILQIFVIPADEGGVRLVVNESVYPGALAAGRLCSDGSARAPARFQAPSAGEGTFVLADKLREVHFQYLAPPERVGEPPVWLPEWDRGGWPTGIRILMAPLEPTPGRLQPISVTVPVYIYRDPEVVYHDQ